MPVLRRLAVIPARRKVLLVVGLSFLAFGLGLMTLGLLSLEGEAGPPPPPAVVIDLGVDDEFLRLLERPRAPTASPTPVIPAEPPLPESGYRMVIDKIGVNAPVDVYGLDENMVPVVPTGPDAREVVAWYSFSAKPGTGSNAVFAGHVTWNGRAVFYDLMTLQPGDVVRLVGTDGNELTYTVSANFAVDPNDPESLKVMSPTETDVITLITCGGTFFETDDPVAGGDYTLRVIVRADLTDVKTATGPSPNAAG
jgi:LPXTG-site transpeptidase (sortase) family protein